MAGRIGDQGKWARSLGNLIGESVAPLIAVFLPRVNFDEYATQVNHFSDAIANELLPYVSEHYRTLPGARHRAMTGIASGGFASVFVGLRKPDVISKVAVQSFYFRGEMEVELRSMITEAKRNDYVASFYVEWSRNDIDNGRTLQSEKHSRELAKLLEANSFDLVTHEASDGAGWGGWRSGTERILERLFPLEDR